MANKSVTSSINALLISKNALAYKAALETLGLRTAGFVDTGTTVGCVPVLLIGNKLPVVDGSNLTGLTASMVSLGNVSNTSDTDKPVSTVQQTALNFKANLNNTQLTGEPTAPDVFSGANNNQIANTRFVQSAIQAFPFAPLESPIFTGTVTVPTPTSSTDAVTKGYADAITQSLDIKTSVRVASTANIAIASALTNNSTIDGVVVATDDRVLLKNQTIPSQNGIYVVVASGAASRSIDANTSAKVTTGMYVFVSAGTVSADMGYVLTTNDSITLGTTNLSFTQFSGAGQIVAGSGISKSGNTLSVNTSEIATTELVSTATNLKISSDITGVTGGTRLTNIIQITQQGYNLLTSPLPSVSTLYIIVG
jgi:hypothetical protein